EREPRRPLTFDRLYTELIDDLHPIKAVGEDAYQMARLTRGQFGKAEYFLERGTFDFDTFANTGKPLKEILAPVRSDLGGLRDFLSARRAVELEESGRKSGFEVDKARMVVEADQGKYGKIADELVTYQNNLLKYLKDSGVVSEGSFDAMVEANKNYVPFYRLIVPEQTPAAAGSKFGPGNPIHKLKGSEREIIDPLESIIKNTYAYVSIAERNAAGIEIIDALKAKGLKAETVKPPKPDAEFIDFLKEQGVNNPEKLWEFARAAQPEGETISAYRAGVRESVKVDDPELVAAFRGLDRQSVGLLTKVFAVPAKALRAGAVLTPDFMARNLIRDFMTAFVNTKGLVFHPADTLSGLYSVLRHDAAWENWARAGGANPPRGAPDRLYLQESLTRLAGETGLMERSWNVVKSPLTGLRMVSEAIENATRVAEFKKQIGQVPSKAEM